VSTLAKRTSKRLRRDLIRRVEGLGLPVTAIVPRGTRKLQAEDVDVLAAAGGMGLG
jgi:hypothetical protein